MKKMMNEKKKERREKEEKNMSMCKSKNKVSSLVL
jgi:hypothetical protein